MFGLSNFPISEFELVAEELLMSNSVIKAGYCSSPFSKNLDSALPSCFILYVLLS